MSIVIMKSKPIIENNKDKLKQYIDTTYNTIGYKPKLVVIKSNNDKASDIYINNKRKFCEDVGMEFELKTIPTNETAEHIYNLIWNEVYYNTNTADGIIVQKPIDKLTLEQEQSLFNSISKRMDVDALGSERVIDIYSGKNDFLPCTVQGVIDLLDYYNVPIQGKNIVILGRSNIVGKPLALALLNRNATVTVCHSKTENIKEITRNAEIIISAIGKPKMIDRSYISLKCKCIIDVGINRNSDNKICGDCDFDDIVDWWNGSQLTEDRFITPVPGGVGPLTVMNLVKNTYKSFSYHKNIPLKLD